MSMLPPAPSVTPGLDFSNLSYGKQSTKRFAKEVAEARHLLTERLQTFSELECVFKFQLVDGDFVDPPIWIDARTKPVKMLDAAPVEDPQLSFELVVQPEQVEELRVGWGDDPSTVVFMKSQSKKGDLIQAIRFADLLTSEPSVEPTHIKDLNRDELPKPTEDIEQVKRDIKKWGYGMLANALSPEQVSIMKKALQEQAAGERKAGVAILDGGPTRPNQRVLSLFNKGEEFADLMNHPAIDAVIPWSKPVALNIFWLLCDTNEENGGTRLFPGSHIGNIRPRNVFSSEGSIACEAPAGTALFFEGRIWHGTGEYKGTGGERPVILSLFCNKSIRPKDNCFLSLDWDVEDDMSDRLKAMCGYRTAIAGIGGFAGEPRSGIFLRRPRGDDLKLVGKIRAPHDEAELTREMVNGCHASNAQSEARAESLTDPQKRHE
ncbi:Dioxygenase [Pseudocercospora fuligena]|uniref:Dioxygenase n=1 Tax=Pseudocercospora fuligena TaxID=685502 RepID=A0A8H6RDK8_9PEZI|nr:Dioxygenase [Pseudocercospora fuligena]